MYFSSNLKYLREAEGHTQQQLASFLSISRATVSSYELGDRHPDPSRLLLIARIYGVPVDSLLKDNYYESCFVPPVCQFDEEAGSHPDSVAEDNRYHHDLFVPKPTEKQLLKKMETIYHQLDYEDKQILILIAKRLLSDHTNKS